MIWNCGMQDECINQERVLDIVQTDTGVEAIHPTLGIHETYDDAQKCVHSQDPAAWKKLNQR